MASVLESFQLNNRVAIVTGASRGLGAGMALALAQAGADVALVARGDTSTLADQITASGRKCAKIAIDVGEPGAAEKIVAETVSALGRADILVNNAGIIRRAAFVDFTEQDWREVVDVNLNAAFRLSQVFARQLIAKKSPGKIINVTSMLSFQGGVRVASYTAAKSALNGLTKLMANELSPHGINVNAVAPGTIGTALTRAVLDTPEKMARSTARIPCGRIGEPEEIASAVGFLASDQAAYMHGHTLVVDGGWLAI